MLRRFGIVWLTLGLLLVGSARAEAEQGNVVWYRASESCPSGEEFLARLGARTRFARLAAATDHIDFVVTLVVSNGKAVGRLERQTQSGTVAIRELADESCPRVADALALSLSLALDPAAAAPVTPQPPQDAVSVLAPPPSTTPPSTTPPSTTLAPASTSPAPAQPTPKQPVPAAPSNGPAASGADVARRGRAWLGASGGVLLGVSASTAVRGALFLQLDDPWAALPWPHALRTGVVGARGSSATQLELVQQWLWAGRVELCPWLLARGVARVEPCAGFELGVSGASGERDTALHPASVWAAPAGELRASLAPAAWLRVELAGGALVPLRRNELYAGTRQLYQPEIIALEAGLGVSFSWQ